MYKKGIYSLDKLISEMHNIDIDSERYIDIGLYADLIKYDVPAKDKLAEVILNRFPMANGTYKRTHSNRFKKYDNDIVGIIVENIRNDKIIKVHDAAISDGRTACDFYELIKSQYSNIQYCGSDRDFEVYVYESRAGEGKKIVKDSTGNILQIVYPPFVLNLNVPKNAIGYKFKKCLFQPVNVMLSILLRNSLIQGIFIPVNITDVETIKLLSLGALAMEDNNPDVSLRRYDLFDEPFDKHDVVRAMNVINYSYFNEGEAKLIANNLKRSLLDRGIMIIASNNMADSEMDGNVFQKRNGKLYELKNYGKGAPFKEVFLSNGD
jgi:hypothetical protein